MLCGDGPWQRGGSSCLHRQHKAGSRGARRDTVSQHPELWQPAHGHRGGGDSCTAPPAPSTPGSSSMCSVQGVRHQQLLPPSLGVRGDDPRGTLEQGNAGVPAVPTARAPLDPSHGPGKRPQRGAAPSSPVSCLQPQPEENCISHPRGQKYLLTYTLLQRICLFFFFTSCHSQPTKFCCLLCR